MSKQIPISVGARGSWKPDTLKRGLQTTDALKRGVRTGIWVVLGVTVAMLGTAAAEPPRVVKAIPQNNAQEIDPDLKEIRVEFDQPMSHGGWSVVGGGPKFPNLVGKGKWEDEKTFV